MYRRGRERQVYIPAGIMVVLFVAHSVVSTRWSQRLERIDAQIRSPEQYVDELLDACVMRGDVLSCSIAAVGCSRTANVEGKRRQDCERARETLDEFLRGTGE
jgi:hypothetical protein